ncbi:MAG: hypothetical protein H0T78_03200, partial [Longispora sp.]|nr:hypothetical protein [Longispora sp. (in: high G+C Gram-positive bacteria)]
WAQVLIEALTGPTPVDPTVLEQVSKGFNGAIFAKDNQMRARVQAAYDAKVAALSDERYTQLQARLADVAVTDILGPDRSEVLRTALVHSQIHLVAGTDTDLDTPYGVAWDATNNRVLIADTGNHRVVAVAADGTVTLLAGRDGQGGIVGTALHFPRGVAWDAVNNRVLTVDTDHQRVVAVAADGIVTTLAGRDDQGTIVGTALKRPNGVAWDAVNNRVLIADTYHHRVVAVASDGTVTTLAGRDDQGTIVGTALAFPSGVAVDAVNNRVLIADSGIPANQVVAVDAHGTTTVIAGTRRYGHSPVGTRAAHADLDYPQGVATDATGRVLIADTNNHRLLVTQ